MVFKHRTSHDVSWLLGNRESRLRTDKNREPVHGRHDRLEVWVLHGIQGVGSITPAIHGTDENKPDMHHDFSSSKSLLGRNNWDWFHRLSTLKSPMLMRSTSSHSKPGGEVGPPGPDVLRFNTPEIEEIQLSRQLVCSVHFWHEAPSDLISRT